MHVEVRLPSAIADRLRTDLARPNPFGGESVGFIATRSVGAGDTIVVTAHDYLPVGAEGYLPADDVGVRINSSAIRSAIEWGMSGKQGVWHVHMHGGRGSPPALSGTDDDQIPRLVQALTHSCPSEIHGLLIFNVDRATAEAWTPIQGRRPAAIVEVGWPLRHLSEGWRCTSGDPRYDRQSFLGPNATEILGKTKVGIVGLGGGGSHLCQQLAHLGIGSIALFDPDILEDTNLPRTVGATEQDVVERAPKVAIASRVARGANKSVELRPHHARWQERPEELRRCHIVIGAVHTFAERRELEATCRRFLIPYIDIGMDVFPGTRPSHRMAGQVLLSLPGGPCMRCLGFLTDERLSEEARMYGAAGGRPQVVWANGILASSAVGLAVDLLTAWTGAQRRAAYLSYDGNSGLVIDHPLLRERNGLSCSHFPLELSGEPKFVEVG